ncbi:MAG: PduL/EutD family phosphate acyltransferase [Patescibacteria group bacterium]
MYLIPLVIQHRHVHLSKSDLRQLFGDEKNLHVELDLGHRGQVLYRETVSVVGRKGTIECVRVLGPSRRNTQVEISSHDAVYLGTRSPIRHSGDLKRAGSCKLVTKFGSVRASSTVIIPARHLHCSDRMAQKLHVKNQEVVSLQHTDRSEIVIPNVLVRVHPTFALEFHLTEDEAATQWIQNSDSFILCS